MPVYTYFVLGSDATRISSWQDVRCANDADAQQVATKLAASSNAAVEVWEERRFIGVRQAPVQEPAPAT